jgi:peptidoglycan/xylan/chitin deacetylase (PgdA/CDA1 family)
MVVSNYKVLMFHYVRPLNGNNLVYLNFFSQELFCDFLDKELDRLKLISPEGFLGALKNNSAIPDNALLLSFDDGLKDHYTWVFPELVKRGLGAFFFINTDPILNKKMLLVHKIHLLSGLLGYPELRDRFVKAIKDDLLFDHSVFADPLALKAYPYDKPETAYFKYALNYLLPKEALHLILDILLAENFNTDTLFNEFYLNEREISDMFNMGMTFGYHGHTHTPFSGLQNDQLREELETEDVFFAKLGIHPCCLSYPHGDQSSVNADNIGVLARKGIKAAFMAEKFEPYSKLQLSRVDCKEILNGSVL